MWNNYYYICGLTNPERMIHILILAALYFIPTIIGWNHKNGTAIFLLNLFLGWTFLGWVAALIWAVAE